MRALLSKPAAVGALIGGMLFSAGMIGVFAMDAPGSAATSVCGPPPTSSAVLTRALTGQNAADDSPTPTDSPTDTSTATSADTGTGTPADTSTDTTSSTPSSSGSSGTSDGTGQSTAADTSSPSATPSPTPTSSPTTAPTPQLCVNVQSYPSVAAATPGGDASFIVSAWTTNADSTGVSVSASADPAPYAGTPSFSICPTASGTTCQLGDISVGQVYELLVSVPVDASTPATTQIDLTAQVSATGSTSDADTGTDIVAAQTTAVAPPPSDVTPPLQPLPLPGTSVSPISPAQLFPTVNPAPSTKALGLPPARPATTIHASEVSATVPFDPRLIGAQLAGLAVLVAAVTIAIMRLSLRVVPPTPAPPTASQVAEPPGQA